MEKSLVPSQGNKNGPSFLVEYRWNSVEKRLEKREILKEEAGCQQI